MRPAANEPGWREHLLFFGKFLRHPRTVGSIAPSSRALAAEMVRGLDLTRDARVVELGAGTGAFTAAIVNGIDTTSRFLAIDRESQFVERIHRRWPHVQCVCASASALPSLLTERGMMPVDHIISGLPFASLPAATTAEILAGIGQSLRPGGTFTTFQYVHAYGLPPAVAFRRDIDARLSTSPVKTLVMRNLPPAYVLRWQRR